MFLTFCAPDIVLSSSCAVDQNGHIVTWHEDELACFDGHPLQIQSFDFSEGRTHLKAMNEVSQDILSLNECIRYCEVLPYYARSLKWICGGDLSWHWHWHDSFYLPAAYMNARFLWVTWTTCSPTDFAVLHPNSQNLTPDSLRQHVDKLHPALSPGNFDLPRCNPNAATTRQDWVPTSFNVLAKSYCMIYSLMVASGQVYCLYCPAPQEYTHVC